MWDVWFAIGKCEILRKDESASGIAPGVWRLPEGAWTLVMVTSAIRNGPIPAVSS